MSRCRRLAKLVWMTATWCRDTEGLGRGITCVSIKKIRNSLSKELVRDTVRSKIIERQQVSRVLNSLINMQYHNIEHQFWQKPPFSYKNILFWLRCVWVYLLYKLYFSRFTMNIFNTHLYIEYIEIILLDIIRQSSSFLYNIQAKWTIFDK